MQSWVDKIHSAIGGLVWARKLQIRPFRDRMSKTFS